MENNDLRHNDNGIRKIVKLIGDCPSGGGFLSREERRICGLIDECCYEISNEDASYSTLKELVNVLREYFDSEYCAIGKVDGEFMEDCVVSWVTAQKVNKNRIQERNLKNVKRVRLDNHNCCVSKGLESMDIITVFDNVDEIKNAENYSAYEMVLGDVSNTTIVAIRNKDKLNKGFVQLINSKRKIVFEDIKPFYDSLLRLVLLIHQSDGLKDAKLFKKDADFLSEAQKKIDNVDSLLKDIMEYLSKEFSAGVVSYRIPLLVGTEGEPLFYLRECYLREEISRFYSREDYFRDRLIKNAEQIGGYKKLICKEIAPVIIDKAKDTEYYSRIADDQILFREDTLIIPILRDYYEKDECFNPLKNTRNFCGMETTCSFRFAKYFGIFKLRILKSHSAENEDVSEWLSEETKKRLSNLAKHISILLNAIVEKNENKSLETFQKALKGTLFTKIKQFDEQCSIIIKRSIHTKHCVIYRYENNRLSFSACSDSNSEVFNNFSAIIEKCCGFSGDLVKTLFAKKEPVYYVSKEEGACSSIMLVPMIRKDNSKLGVVLLAEKEGKQKSNLSKTFWEHDKKHIEFIVDVLTRIEESDSERLTFLSQLSHELLRPVTEMVYRNGYHVSTATRDSQAYSKGKLISELQRNIDMCMMFKYIIDDVEYIYSLSKGEVQYNFEMVDFKGVILAAIKFFEEEASATKQLKIKTYLKNLPEYLYIDKLRMTQVIINLLKNAIQYSFPNEEISISYEYNEERGCHEIDFRDRGIPVNQKEKDDIFGLFFRSKQAVEKRPNGTGIGLYLVKQIMKAHGGDCYVKEYSFPTIFTIQIPNRK